VTTAAFYINPARGGAAVTFNDVLSQTIAMLQQHGRVSYRALKRQFAVDDAVLEDLKYELIEVQQRAVDHGGTVLVWTGDARAAATPAPAPSPSTDVPPFAATPESKPLTYTPPHLAEKIRTSRAALEGERKQVTVLFADLKRSMELLADRDPEEARQLLDPVLERMMAAVHRYEGTVNQVMGDGIMALFGAPIAHEDHAVRACYAALAMQEAMGRYADELRRQQGLDVHIRVGLNSGEVVVRSIGNNLHMDYTAVGQTTHLAARMEQLASPGTTLLTADTQRLVEGYIEVKPLGPVPVKGLPAPVEVCELVGAGPARTRLQALAARGLTPFVGRQAELAALHQTLEQAGAGHGQVVAVIGEPGVGKSRLFAEFLASPLTETWRILETHTVSYGQATPYLPIRDLLKAYTQIDDRDDERAIREKVDKCLTPDVTLQPIRSAVLALLDVGVEDPEWQALDPSQRRLRTLEALKRLLLWESEVQPVVVVCENLHWIDTETQAFLDSLVDSLPTARMLLLVNYRPEYQHPWGSKTYYAQFRLDPLCPRSAQTFLQALLGDDASLAPLKRVLIERTEGNPFFLEESVRTLVESQVLVGRPGAHRLARAVLTVQVPATVQAVLAARMDRLLAEDKTLLQTAAVIGKDVPFPLLQAIGEVPEEALRGALTRLQTAEFLYEKSLFPELEYTFKHALTQQVAYRSLLQERRRILHTRSMEAIEALAGDRVADQVERLAYHALRGEVWDRALSYCWQAGAKAAGRSAHREAVACFEQALDALRHLPESRDTLQQAIDLRFELRNALVPLAELQRVHDCLREAETLAMILDDPQRLGRLYCYMTSYFWVIGEPERAIASGHRALALGEFALQVDANLFLGQAYCTMGEYRRAMEFLGRNVVSLGGDLIRERFGIAVLPSVMSRIWLAWCLAECGKFTQGMTYSEEGLQVAEASEHPYTLTVTYFGLGLLCLSKGEIQKAIPVLERGLRLCQSGNLPIQFSLIASALGYAYALSGRITEALPLLERAVSQAESMGRVDNNSLRVAWLSEAYLLDTRIDEARRLAERALELSQRHKERGHHAHILRLLGEIAAQRDPPEVEQAEGHYRQALALAEELGMRPLVAHCHHGLGRLYCQTGRGEEARAALTAAIALYHAMDMTFWLPQVEAALAQVEGE
jgi:class 3 adenylate cyclase/tetratricopeptide (TPR) repeat protein